MERYSAIFRLAFYGFLAVVALVLLYKTREFGDNPVDYGLPRAITVLFLVLLSIQIVRILRPGVIERFTPESSTDTFDEFADDDDRDDDTPVSDVLRTIGWVVGFVGMVYLLGYLIVVPLFIGLYVWYNLDLKRAITTVVVFCTGGYVLFIRILEISLHQGRLIELLGL